MSEELLDSTPPRSVRWLVVAAALVIVGALVARWLLSTHGGHHDAIRTPSPSVRPPTATISAAPVPAPEPTVTDPATIAVNRVVARAESVAAATAPPDRAAQCRASAKGTDALDVITAALTAHVPGFTVADGVEVGGRNHTLCEVDVRARNALGGTVVVSIVAPPVARGPAVQVRKANDRTVVRAVVTFDAGWRVEVGWVAQTGAHVSTAGLTALAHDRALRW